MGEDREITRHIATLRSGDVEEEDLGGTMTAVFANLFAGEENLNQAKLSCSV
jgi:hypothetical protein